MLGARLGGIQVIDLFSFVAGSSGLLHQLHESICGSDAMYLFWFLMTILVVMILLGIIVCWISSWFCEVRRRRWWARDLPYFRN